MWLERKAVPWRAAALAIIVVFGAIGLPFGVPILGPERMARYAAAIGESPETNTGESIALPQDYADMLGWEDQVRATAEVYRSLSPTDRDAAVILGTNYGRAGAHDHFGPAFGLPGAVSPIGSYWYFGPGKKPGNVVVVIGGDREEIAPMFESVELAGRVTGEWRVPEERDVPVWVARSPKVTLQQVWPRFEGEH